MYVLCISSKGAISQYDQFYEYHFSDEFHIPSGYHEFHSSPKKPGRKAKKRKRSNDPDRKKPKLTGYTLFMKEFNSTVRKENPSLEAKDVVQKVAQLWQSKSDEEKQEWKSKAEAKSNEEVDNGKETLERNDNNEKVDASKVEDNKKDSTSEVV